MHVYGSQLYANMPFDPNGELAKNNVWGNMDHKFNPATTKKIIREKMKEEAMRKQREEHRKQQEEFAKTLKNLEDLKQKYLLEVEENAKKLTVKQPIKQPATQATKQPAKTVAKTTQKKTPKGKK